MADTTNTTSKTWKVWVLGIAIILGGISGCTVSLLTGGNASDSIKQGIEGITQGVDTIKTGEAPAQE